MMRLYVAGPMRGVPEFNFPAFDACARKLAELGHEPFSPAQRDRERGWDPAGLSGFEDLASVGFDLRVALAEDVAWICAHAEGIVVLPGWEHSRGARAEVALGRALGAPILQLEDRGAPVPPRLYEVTWTVEAWTA